MSLVIRLRHISAGSCDDVIHGLEQIHAAVHNVDINSKNACVCKVKKATYTVGEQNCCSTVKWIIKNNKITDDNGKRAGGLLPFNALVHAYQLPHLHGRGNRHIRPLDIGLEWGH